MSRPQTRGVDAYGATAAFLSNARRRTLVLAAFLVPALLLSSGCVTTYQIVQLPEPVSMPEPSRTPRPQPTPQSISISVSMSVSASSSVTIERPIPSVFVRPEPTYVAPAYHPSYPTSSVQPASYSRPYESPRPVESFRPSNPSAGASTPVTSRFVHAALSQLGKPYVYGATGPDSFDCSSLVSYAARAAGMNFGRLTSYQLASMGSPVSSLLPGDLLLKPGHVAIYAGGNRIVHASGSAGRVVMDSYNPADFTSARRIEGMP